MITYTKHTVNDAMQDVLLRVRSYVNEYNIDHSHLFSAVMRATKKIANLVSSQTKTSFINTVTGLTNFSVLPLDFVEPTRLLVTITINGNSSLYEARYINIREWFSLSFWDRRHSWNYGGATQPVYTWVVDANRNKILYLAPDNFWDPNFTGTTNATLDYFAFPNEMAFWPTSPLPIPEEFYELMILEAVEIFLSLTSDNYYLLNNHKKLIEDKKSLLSKFIQQIIESKRELDSFVEPVPPLVNPPPVTGELPQNLANVR